MATIAETFDDHWIEQPGPLSTPCWIWQRGCKGKEVVSGGGYGCLKIKGKTIGAHRFAYERTYGEIPEGLQAAHLCHNTKCVNPDHLEAITNDENQEQKALAGRAPSKLSVEDVQWIRKACAEGTLQRVVADLFNLHQADVSNIVNRKYWKYVE